MSKSEKNYIIVATLFFVFGVIFSLTFRQVKYTELIKPPIIDISPKVAYENLLKDPNKYILIDVRSEGEYNDAHAATAVNLPIHYMYDDTHGIKNSKNIPLPKNNNQEIYLICTGGRLAGIAYSYLEHYGYRNIKRIEHGLAGWNDSGLPIITPGLFKNTPERSFNSNSSPVLDKPYEVN